MSIAKTKIEKDSLAAAKVRFWGELRTLGLSQAKKAELLQQFEHWYEQSLDYDLASSRVLEHIMSQKKSISFQNIYKGLFGNGYLDKQKEKLTRFIDSMFNEGKDEREIVAALILEAREQLGGSIDSVGVDKIRLWVLQEKVKLKVK